MIEFFSFSQATSIRLSTLIQVVVMGLSAIVVSFVYEWRLTLLIFAFIPLLLFAGAMYTTINTSFAAKEKETLIQAASVSLATKCVFYIHIIHYSTITFYPTMLCDYYTTKQGRCHGTAKNRDYPTLVVSSGSKGGLGGPWLPNSMGPKRFKRPF